MASDDNNKAGTGVDNNKENSEKEGLVGIEANDLATLLNRFEEATSSDDINLPRAVNKTKWNIMKAKSAGNSPAITPPATPPPTRNDRAGPIRLKTFTQTPPGIRNQGMPIRLTVVNPISLSTLRATSSPSPLSINRFTKISTNSIVPSQPKVQIQIPNAGLPSTSVLVTMTSGQSLSKSVFSSPVSPLVISQAIAKNVKNELSVSLAVKSDPSQSVRQVIKIPFRSEVAKECVQSSSSQSSNTSNATTQNRTFNVLRMPALDAASPYNVLSSSVKQIIPKKRSSSILPNALVTNKVRKLESSSSPVKCSTASLLETVLANQSSLLTSKLTSTAILSQHTPSVNLGASKTLSSVPKTIETPKVPEPKIQRDEHTYFWSGPCFNNKNSQRIGLSSSVSDLSPQTADSACLNMLESDQSHESNQSGEVVLEEGEVNVDANGNDIFSKDGSRLPDYNNHQDMSNRVVCFDTGDNTLIRRGRKYRRRDDLSNSPVREDTSAFFDKIPSHYTALSIPAKQIRKTVFESVSGTIGSQDHLAMPENEVAEGEDEGQYNKVPAHHRIFTNTSQEVELFVGDEPSCSLAEEDRPQQESSRRRRMSSTSRHSGRSASSHRSNRSVSRLSHGSSRSRSPANSDYSMVGDRISRPLTRRRNSSHSSHLSNSSCSSSCSSNSYCSTCGASLSRSRSRSFSSSRERSYSPDSHGSRSRSRSPRVRTKRRRTRSSRSSSPEYSRSKWRSESRSQSPPVRRRRNSYRTSSRSRRHQMKERSSAERKIMELRKQREDDKVKAMEERRVLYVGKLPDNYTKQQLRKRFECFGEIKGVRLNFRVHGDNYGFVTFAYACDAFAAKEKGNNLPGQAKFDLCFGGRRRFCPDKYADLDGNREIEEEYAPLPSRSTEELDYAALLKQHVNQQKKRR